ncbi:MAG: RNA polymerase sigma factor [Planctomycetes bacterium]|nr:RNA polymerase sigma factor [Planctomycetota bacterium]
MSDAPEQNQPHRSPASWAEIVDSFDAPTIFVVIGSWLGPDARAAISVEDVWQDALWMAWRDRNQHEWQGLARYRAWLLGIARNRVHDALRMLTRKKRGGGRTARFSDLGGHDTVGGMLPPRSTTPSRMASHMERARVLESALATLEQPLQDVVRLRIFEEQPMEQAAQRLGIPLSTAKHRLVRGMQAYRAELQQRLGDSTGSASSGAGEP